MGMYDIVLPEINLVISKCPNCKTKFNKFQEWQTKSYNSLLQLVSLRTLKNKIVNFEVHTICNNCNNYIQLTVVDNRKLISYSKDMRDTSTIRYKKLTKNQDLIYDILTYKQENDLLGGYIDEDT